MMTDDAHDNDDDAYAHDAYMHDYYTPIPLLTLMTTPLALTTR